MHSPKIINTERSGAQKANASAHPGFLNRLLHRRSLTETERQERSLERLKHDFKRTLNRRISRAAKASIEATSLSMGECNHFLDMIIYALTKPMPYHGEAVRKEEPQIEVESLLREMAPASVVAPDWARSRSDVESLLQRDNALILARAINVICDGTQNESRERRRDVMKLFETLLSNRGFNPQWLTDDVSSAFASVAVTAVRADYGDYFLQGRGERVATVRRRMRGYNPHKHSRIRETDPDETFVQFIKHAVEEGKKLPPEERVRLSAFSRREFPACGEHSLEPILLSRNLTPEIILLLNEAMPRETRTWGPGNIDASNSVGYIINHEHFSPEMLKTLRAIVQKTAKVQDWVVTALWTFEELLDSEPFQKYADKSGLMEGLNREIAGSDEPGVTRAILRTMESLGIKTTF